MLVYFFVLLTFKTPSLSKSSIKGFAGHIALLTALFFACHPLQIQAVTYIWQRVTSLSTMFYLLSLLAYIKWRLAHQLTLDSSRLTGNRKQGGRWFFYALSILCAVLAMKTKEIAFMLPAMLILYELIFFEGNIQKRVLYLIPFLLTMLIIPLTLISIDRPIGEMIGDLDERIKRNAEFSRGEYLLAQFRVLVTYLRLIFMPVNQNLDYGYPGYYSFFNIEVFSSFVFLAVLFGLSIYLLFRYRDSVPHMRLISFGIIWFFVNLLIESSVIPLDNVIYEHRMYLPSVGVFSALTVAIFIIINRWTAYARVMTVTLAAVILALTGATYARNAVWKDGVTLWRDVVSKSPNKARGYNNLGNAYSNQDQFEQAIEQYRIAIRLNPNYTEAHYNLAAAYIKQGRLDEAMMETEEAIRLNYSYVEAYNNLSTIYRKLGRYDEAVKAAEQALQFKPDFAVPYNNLGLAYAEIRQFHKAKAAFDKAISLDSNYTEAYSNLGALNMVLRKFYDAIEILNKAVAIDPNYIKARLNLGLAYFYIGNQEAAKKEYRILLQISPDHAKKLLSVISRDSP
jgi:tetratricopeptide (TPR) repeat protein